MRIAAGSTSTWRYGITSTRSNQHVIMSLQHHVVVSSCSMQHTSSSAWYNVFSLAACRHVIKSACRNVGSIIVSMPACQHDIMRACQHVIMSSGHHIFMSVIMSLHHHTACNMHHCQHVIMSVSWQHVSTSSHCHVGMSACHLVIVPAYSMQHALMSAWYYVFTLTVCRPNIK